MGTAARVKSSRFDGQEEIKLAEGFLNKAHGFATIKRESQRAVRFTDLAKDAFRASLISSHEAEHEFGLDVDKVKKGKPTGIATTDRNRFINIAAMRAYDVIELNA